MTNTTKATPGDIVIAKRPNFDIIVEAVRWAKEQK